MTISPPVGWSWPSSKRKSTDLPAPLGPTNPTRSPCQINNFSPARTIFSSMPSLAGNTLSTSLSLQHLVAAPPALQIQPHPPPLQHRLVDALDAVDTFLNGLAADDQLWVVIGAPPNQQPFGCFFQPGDLPLLNLEHLLLAQEAGLFLEGEFRVVAGVDGDASIFQIGDLVRHHIQQIAVVGNDDDTAFVASDQPFQKRLARQIQMIVRLVKQE